MAYASIEIQSYIREKITDNLSDLRKQRLNCLYKICVSPVHGSGFKRTKGFKIHTASNVIVKYLKGKSVESRKMLFVILFLFLSTTFGLFLIVLKAFLFILSYSIRFLVLLCKVLLLVIKAIRFSPLVTLIMIICRFMDKTLTKESLYFCMPVFFIWLIYFSLAVTVCCGFFIRMFGFVLVGLIINAEKAAPYAAFVLIFLSNIYTSYNTLRIRFKGMKKIIFKYYKKKSRDIPRPNVHIIRKTLPEKLFWDVCKDVLPIEPEIFAMLANMLIIFSVSLLALAIIVFFREVFNSSTLVEAGAVMLSGKLAGILFNGMIKGEKFTGWDKIEKSEKVQECIDEYIQQCESENRVTLDIEDSARESMTLPDAMTLPYVSTV